MTTRTITKAAMQTEIAEDLQYISENDGTLWQAWQAVDEDYNDDHPVEVRETGDETLYILRGSGEADFALATYGQSEPRFAPWALDPTELVEYYIATDPDELTIFGAGPDRRRGRGGLMASKHGAPWTPEDDEELERRFRLGQGDAQIGEALGRTARAVNGRRLNKLRLLEWRSGNWSAEDRAALKSMTEAGQTAEEIADALHRTEMAVHLMRKRLGLIGRHATKRLLTSYERRELEQAIREEPTP